MYKTWSASSEDQEALSRDLEAHLNEYAEEVLSVSYSVADGHHVLAVYRAIEPTLDARHEAAVSVAEHIIDQAHA